MGASAMPQNGPVWFLVQTKQAKERWVRDQLAEIVPEAFLPLLKTRVPRWGRPTWSVAPLFPRYVFARFEFETQYFDVRYVPGVRQLVSAGRDPLVVPESIIDEIKRRQVDGLVQIQEKPFATGESVRVVEGPFSGFEAIFERYFSGAERVAVLLSSVESAGLRVVLPASFVSRHI
jgi:transcriptional antiterminator RfaH